MKYPKLFCNILNTHNINSIIEYINNNILDFGNISPNDYWSGRTLFYNDVKDNYIKHLILDSIKFGLSELTSDLNKQLYCEHLSIARWPVGYDLQPHADAENPDNNPPHPYPWRHFAMITFLNNNFDGGILYFPNQNIEIVPQPGYTICFPGTLEYLHGVSKITQGSRYTIASFLTYNQDKASIKL